MGHIDGKFLVKKVKLFLKIILFTVALMCVGALIGLFVGFHYGFNPVISVIVFMTTFSMYLGYWIYSCEQRADKNFAKFRQMQVRHETTSLLLNEAIKDTNTELFDRVAPDAPDSLLKQQYQKLKLLEHTWDTRPEG